MGVKMVRQFIKDYRFPVKVSDENHFWYYLQYVSEHYDYSFETARGAMEDMLDEIESEDDFIKHCRIASQDAIESVKNLKTWETFGMGKIDGAQNTHGIRTSGLYSPSFVGESYISIDLVKANFNILRDGDDPHSVGVIPVGCDYDEFIQQFSGYDYVTKSKQIRQIIFGNLNPKRQRVLQTKAILGMADYLVEKGIRPESFAFYSPDELVVCTANTETVAALAEEYLSGLPFRAEVFSIRHLGHNCYTKEYPDGTFKLRNVPSTLFMQALKHRLGDEIQDEDLVFEFEKRLARFIEPLKFGESK